jgi:hypothetical protein
VKKKVRKFASGGDILTGVGAVLLGKHLYDKYKEGKGKSDEDSEYSRKVKEFRDKKEAEATAVESKAEPKTVSAGEKRAMAASQGRPELIPEGADEAVMRSDNYASRKPVVTTTPKKPAPAAKKATPAAKKAEPAAKSEAPKSVAFKPAEDSKKAESPVKLGSPGSYKFDSKPDLSTPKGFDLKGTNKTAYGTDTTSVFQKKAAQERAEAEEKAKKKAKEQANIRSGESERMMRDSLGSGFKRGGAVKKYASGGSVSSASKRADGIAQRGKTRGKVC